MNFLPQGFCIIIATEPATTVAFAGGNDDGLIDWLSKV